MFSNKNLEFYSSNLAEYVEKLQTGDLKYIPWIFCVFAENSVSHKLKAAQALNEMLKSFSVDDICRMDIGMRETTSMEWSINWKALCIQKFITKQMTEDQQRAVLIFASFNPNGYIRERAVELLGSYGQTLPFVLLRLNDWVYEVRQAALTALSNVLKVASDEDFIEAIPFVEKLRQSERCHYDDISSIIMGKLDSQNALMDKGLMSKDIRTRRFCISVLMHSTTVDNIVLLGHLKREKDPFLRRIIFQSWLQSNINIEKISEQMLKDKYPANRILALKSLNKHNPTVAFEAARKMLLDRNAKIRALAREIVLEKEKGMDFHQFYLDNLAANTPVSLYGLGEIGKRKDVSLIVHFLADDRIAVIRAAMTALMRLDSETFFPQIISMLSSQHVGIVKTSALLIKKYKVFNFEEIFEIQKSTESEHTKIKCASLLFLAPKWKSLMYMLMLIGSDFEKLDNLCQIQIKRWLSAYNRSYAVASADEKYTIKSLLDAKKIILTPEIGKELMFLLK